MKENSLSKCVWTMVAFVFLLLGTCNEVPAQDWSIKQLKDSLHPILEASGKQFDFRDYEAERFNLDFECILRLAGIK